MQRVDKVQIIEKDGQPEYAVVPYAEFERLTSALEDAQDVVDFDQAKAELEGQETIPGEVVDRLIAGQAPLKAWREHRGLTLELFRKLARVLDTSIDELVGWEE